MATGKLTQLILALWPTTGLDKNMNILIKQKLILLFLLIWCLPLLSFASNVFFDAKNQAFRQGEEFLVNVFLDTEGESVNTAEGTLIFPADLLEMKEIRNGNSSINFWINPVGSCASNGAEKPGSICFLGITPGGFSGTKVFLFSVVFQAKKDGQGTISAEALRILQNDGQGTEVRTKTSPFSFSISTEAKAPVSSVERIIDNERPEDFKPIIGNDPNIFNGKYFLVFITQDKISGIANYQVREGAWGWFSIAESPYLLKYQSLDRKIFVKAIDKAGNERVVVLKARHQAPWYQQSIMFVIILLIIVAGFLFKKLWSRFTK